MVIHYLCQSLKAKESLGQLIRREGIILGLHESEIEVIIHEIQPKSIGIPNVLKFWNLGRHSEYLKFIDTVHNDHAVVIEGLPLAFGCSVSKKFRALNARKHVDSCDSWVLLSSISRFKQASLPAKISKIVKKLLAQSVINFTTRNFNSISYISEHDSEADSKYISTGCGVIQLPNGINQIAISKIQPSATGPLCLLGDWSYPPNLRMLQNAIEWLDSGKLTTGYVLRIVGPNFDDSLTKFQHIENVGWVDDLSSGLNGCLALLAIIDEGAGTKNKIIDSLSRGLPVIANELALSGIPVSKGILNIDSNSPAEILDKAKALAATGFPIPNFPSWKQAIGLLVSSLSKQA